MSNSGVSPTDLLVRARSTLLDALEALRDHRGAVIVIGAQAVYLRTGGVDVALAEATKDSDVAVDPRLLGDVPLLEDAMNRAGFTHDHSGQPGAWLSKDGIPVDLMVPEALAGGGRRGGHIPPHDSRATRRARGLEAALVDCPIMAVAALDSMDGRRYLVRVAGSGALLVAKLHKLGERVATPLRLNDKDAHDIYRILRAIETEELEHAFAILLSDELSAAVTHEALGYLEKLFGGGPESLGASMAGRAESGVGDPAQVAVSVSFLAEDLLTALSDRRGMGGVDKLT